MANGGDSKGNSGERRRASSRGGSYGGNRSGGGRSGENRSGGGRGRSGGDSGNRGGGTGGRRGQRSERSNPGRGGKGRGGAPRRDDRGRQDDRRYGPREGPKGPDGGGRGARKGADAARRSEGRDEPQEARHQRPPDHDIDRWERVEDTRRSSGGQRRRTPRLEVHLTDSSLSGLTQPQRDRVQKRLGDAAAAFQDERFEDARKILSPMVERHPSVPELHELLGLSLYRLGRWKPALKELEAFTMMTGSTEQHPIMADASRALGRHEDVRRLWEELRHDDPDADVITEGRIVLAGSHADVGDVAGAIRVLEQGPVRVKRPADHHLRLWYSLADMYERAGDLQKALLPHLGGVLLGRHHSPVGLVVGHPIRRRR